VQYKATKKVQEKEMFVGGGAPTVKEKGELYTHTHTFRLPFPFMGKNVGENTPANRKSGKKKVFFYYHVNMYFYTRECAYVYICTYGCPFASVKIIM